MSFALGRWYIVEQDYYTTYLCTTQNVNYGIIICNISSKMSLAEWVRKRKNIPM